MAIDTVTLYAGHGGSGGGIWTYTKQLLLNLNQHAAEQTSIKFYCFVNEAFDLLLNNMEVIKVDCDTRKLPNRMKYLHFTLPNLCKKWRIDLLHRLTPEIPFASKTPVVCTLHDFMAEFYERTGRNQGAGFMDRLRNKYFFKTKSYALQHSKAVLTPSQAIRNEAISQFAGEPNRVFVTELATMPAKVNTEPEKISTKPVQFFTIAAFHPHKGHERTIAVFESLRSATQMDAYLNLRGNIQDADTYNNIQKRIAASPERDRIKIIGFDPSSTLADIYKKADFVLLLSEYEGFGLPVLEAQAFGIPVICSAIETFREVAGEAALFISAKDPELIAKDIHALVTDHNKQQQLVQDGIANCRKYNWFETAAKTIAVYNSCLNTGYEFCKTKIEKKLPVIAAGEKE
ncbi:glycosyltransferase family 4 protein [Cnuella takakiae]|uniref:glycosyltransferase family 4 protein n=1 Tax=Cnuella takakiae TaxID=1302690 RepID=UPI001300E55C|nr:glycosyltransferase family 1 protein [Cnuella takakiae]